MKLTPLADRVLLKPIEALETTTHYDMDGPLLLLLADGELRAVLQALPATPAQ